MGRAKIQCPHGVLGVTNCRECQRIQHTDRVRELRRQRKEIFEEERTLEKDFAREHTFVDVHSVQQTGKGIAKDALVVAKDIGPMVKEPGPIKAPTKEAPNCGKCRLVEFCERHLFYSTYPGARPCPNFKLRR